MAILKDLIVSGSSRLLGKLYTNDIEIGNDLTVTGVTTTTRLIISSTNNPGTLSSTNSSTGNIPLIIGSPTGKHIAIDGDEIAAKNGVTTGAYLYLNYGGSRVYLSNGSQIYADNGKFTSPTYLGTNIGTSTAYFTSGYITTAAITTANTNTINNADMITTSALDVKGKLHAVEYDLENIMDLGGSFVVAPTLIVPSSGSGTKSLTVTKSNNTTVIMTVRDPSITSGGIAGFAWANNYKVKVSGLINNTVLGTCDGYINSTNISSNTISLTVTMDEAQVTAVATTVSNYKLNIMLYNTDTSSATAVTKPLGIYLQHYQLTNNPIINVWNGQTTTPKVRIGYLGGITYNGSSLGTNAQNSWGLYSDSVFLEGQIIAKGGTIAGWTIGDGYITTNSNRTTYDNTSYTGMTMTASGIGARGSATSYFNLSTGGGLTAIGADVTGVIKANTGYIGGSSGWTIAAQQLYSGNIGDDNSLHLGTKNLGNNTSIGGRSGSDWRLTVGQHFGVTNTGALYCNDIHATGGKIGGFNITTDAIYSTTNALGTTVNNVYVGTEGISLGTTFKVTKAGILNATGATITGGITATTLSTGTKTASGTGNGTFIDSSGNIYVGNGSTNNFTVSSSGQMTAKTGSIGGWTINGSSIYSSDTSTIKTIVAGTRTASSTGDGIYIGSNGVLNVGKASGNYLTFDGTNLDLKTDWLNFDSSTQTVSIGKKITNSSLQTKIDGDTFWITNGTIDIAFIGNENRQITDTFVSDGTTTTFTLSSSVASGGTVSPSNVVVSRSGTTLTVTSGLPATGESFTYTYTPTDLVRYYTMGTRLSTRNYGHCSFAEGYEVVASGPYSHAEGVSTTASGSCSHAEGLGNVASGSSSHAEGQDTLASGYFSHAEGSQCQATLSCCHAEGYLTVASGECSHAEGNNTTARGNCAHAEGYHTDAYGYAHAEGFETNALGYYSHAQNRGTSTDRTSQTVIGEYNELDTADTTSTRDPEAAGNTNIHYGKYAFIIGNGTSTDNPSNALTVDWDGNLECNNVGAFYQQSTVVGAKITQANINHYDSGSYVNLPAGTYVLNATWIFQQGSLTGARNLEVRITNASGTVINDGRTRVYAANRNYAILQATAIAELAGGNYYVQASSDVTTTENGNTYIRAVRIK